MKNNVSESDCDLTPAQQERLNIVGLLTAYSNGLHKTKKEQKEWRQELLEDLTMNEVEVANIAAYLHALIDVADKNQDEQAKECILMTLFCIADVKRIFQNKAAATN